MSDQQQQQPSEKALAHMKSSFRFKNIEQVMGSQQLMDVRSNLLADFARNAKKSPATASSGIKLPYVLGLSASFMDPTCSRRIIDVFAQALKYIRDNCLSPSVEADEKILIVGMEVAGGILVSQLACCCEAVSATKFDFAYMRKEKKKTGAAQQLEGIHEIVDRTPETHPKPLRAIWVDDANSTGSSLTAGIEVLKKDYNIQVEAALYACDRSADRQNLPTEKQYFARPEYVEGKVQIFAICDLAEVDEEVAKLQSK